MFYTIILAKVLAACTIQINVYLLLYFKPTTLPQTFVVKNSCDLWEGISNVKFEKKIIENVHFVK